MKYCKLDQWTVITTLSLMVLPVMLGMTSVTSAAEYPEKPIKVYVGFKPGGRTDSVARKISSYINDNNLLAQPLVIVNKPGAASANAAREVLAADPSGYTIMHWSHAMLVSNSLRVNKIHPDDFTSLGYTGGGSPIWAVREDSPYSTFEDLTSHLRNHPESLVEAVGIGTIPHLIGVQLAQDAEFKTRLIGASGAADRLARLIGGNADIALFSGQEYKKYQPNGVRALISFGEKRMENFPEIPTASELGYDVVWANPAWWLGPKNMDPAVVETLSTALKAAIESDEIRNWYNESSLDAYWTDGALAVNDALKVLSRLEQVVSDNNIGQ